MEAGGTRRLNGVLAEGRHASAPAVKPAYLVGGVVLVVLAIAAFFLLKGSGGSAAGTGSVTPETPKFAFTTSDVIAVPTRAGTKAKQLKQRVKPAAKQAIKALDLFYAQAFLDPANWQRGSYDNAWALFDAGASAQAQKNVDTLTAGTGAGSAFKTILPIKGTLKAKVLLDAKDQPFSIVAIVHFSASGAGRGGKSVLLQSQGQYVFQMVDGTWKVVSFHVQRNDQERAAPSPSAGASAGASGSSP